LIAQSGLLPEEAAVRGWIGTPFRAGASVQGAGADCIGLVCGVWRRVCGPEPWAMPAWGRDPDADARALDRALDTWFVRAPGPAAGRVLVFAPAGHHAPQRHLGIALATGGFVHADIRAGVVEARLHRFWRARLIAAFAFPFASGATAP
jgi:NlpC/P60 family putative phage cell wall peptidase